MDENSCMARIRAYVSRCGVDAQDEDDVAQDAILAVLAGKLRCWRDKPPDIRVILQTILAERRLERLPILSAAPEQKREAETAPSAEDLALAEERAALVHDAMVELEREAPDMASALRRHDFEGEHVTDADAARLLRGRARVAEIVRRLATLGAAGASDRDDAGALARARG